MSKRQQAQIILAVLSITFVSKLLETVSPGLHSIGSALNVPYTSLMLLLTIPVLISMPIALLVGPITGTFVRYRTVISAGLLLMAIGGMAPFWLRDWTMILVARGMFGIGQGIIMPLVLALIFGLVAPENQATMMGMQNVVSGIAGMVFSLAAGVLAGMSWTYPFLLNAVTLVTLVIVLIFLPEPARGAVPSGAALVVKPKLLEGLPPVFWVYGILTFAYAVLIFPSMGNISIVFHQLGLSPALAGTALMLLTGGATVAGLIFGKLFKNFGLRTITVGFAAACASQWLFATGSTFYEFAIGELLLGFGSLGLAFAGLCMAAGKSVGREKSALAMSITLTGMNAGTFASPLIFAGVMSLIGSTSMRTPYWMSVIGFGVLAVASLFLKQAVPGQSLKHGVHPQNGSI
ncbi:MFS transporter [Paraburkholderia sp. HP33-1]|uniref:MFS transporter n=1 Tax=Paraburkholderia sp. HP33-1 TaxID=2883243 RepID=UPI001F1D1860|nr:MFS transporter [Paraburkholderia sp. HP33-1]